MSGLNITISAEDPADYNAEGCGEFHKKFAKNICKGAAYCGKEDI